MEIFINKYPFLYELIEKLYELGAIYVNLSGSGSAIFAIFDNKNKKLEYSSIINKYCKVIYKGYL